MFDPDHSLRVVEGAELGSLTDCDLDSVDLSVFGDSRAADSGDDFGNPALYRAWYERNPEIYSFLLSGATLVGYCLSRTFGLPGEGGEEIGNWSEGLGMASLMIEAIVVLLAASALAQRSTPAIDVRSSANVEVNAQASN